MGLKLNDLIASGEPGRKVLLLGNEAIARGAVEAGVSVAASYPGTPSSEIGLTLAQIAEQVGMYFEWSVNEKVAFETAAAAAMSGLRALAFMKHVGLNVAADAFVSLAYTGCPGGFLLVTADDPSCHSSQNEQDNRYYAKLALTPVLEPSTPHEAKEMTVRAYDLSEKHEMPFILRTTTRVSHTRGIVELGEARDRPKIGEYKKDWRRYVLIPANARVRRAVLLEKERDLREEAEKSEFNAVEEGEGEIGVITSGVSYCYVKEAARELGVSPPILKLGFTSPTPYSLIESFSKDLRAVLVVEELEPVLETEVRCTLQKSRLRVEVLGKMTEHIPRAYELNTGIVGAALAKSLGLEWTVEEIPEGKAKAPPRPPVLCPGCPHRGTAYILKQVVGDEAVYSGDIGCYSLVAIPPYNLMDNIHCMGASIGLANGFSKAQGRPVVALIGDSTFFHAGIPALINAVYNRHPMLVVVMDNRITAMTGFQPHPGTGMTATGAKAREVSIEDIAKACGADYVATFDPYDIDKGIAEVKKALSHEIPVLVARRPCAILEWREKRRRGEKPKVYHVDEDKCVGCLKCIRDTGCPALIAIGEKVQIEKELCAGCGLCARVCPTKAVEVVD
ncbi:MAG: indolepyruvate ferredoxin oxidoreductase subunit alpha [Thermoproteota archaeon]|nr:MAG: indolepyruvate ferredoxin oxidoreductase subunit alpha [Candidatus Korarchaeota archaeon]